MEQKETQNIEEIIRKALDPKQALLETELNNKCPTYVSLTLKDNSGVEFCVTYKYRHFETEHYYKPCIVISTSLPKELPKLFYMLYKLRTSQEKDIQEKIRKEIKEKKENLCMGIKRVEEIIAKDVDGSWLNIFEREETHLAAYIYLNKNHTLKSIAYSVRKLSNHFPKIKIDEVICNNQS